MITTHPTGLYGVRDVAVGKGAMLLKKGQVYAYAIDIILILLGS